MNKLLAAFIFYVPVYCYGMDYHKFMGIVYNDSESIKSKQYDLESEKNNATKTNLFFAPKLSFNSTYKKDSADKKYFDDTLNANALIYDSSLANRFKEKDARLEEFSNAINVEKEKVAKLVLENAISIYQYERLNGRAHELDLAAKKLYQQINNRYENGTANQGDLQQANLLVQRIEGDIRRIEQEIENFRGNIEIGTGVNYPKSGITVNDKLVGKIQQVVINQQDLRNNIEYQQLGFQAEGMKQNAKQQNSLFSVSLVGEQRNNNHKRIEDDSYVGVSVDVNIFDLDKNMSEKQKMNQYRSQKSKMDQKYKELSGQLKLLGLQYNSSNIELDNYIMQLDTTMKIIKSQRQEYNIAKTSYYEMLNTEYDYFQLQEKVVDINIKKITNRLSVLALAGRILSL